VIVRDFIPLSAALAPRLAAWFDDPDTIRSLGRCDWLFRELELVHTTPGTELHGRRVLAQHFWVVHDEAGERS